MEDNIKILYIVDSYTNPFAGTEGQLFKLVSGLNRVVFEPHLLIFNPSEYIAENGFPCDYSVLNASQITSLNTWHALYKFLKNKKAEGYNLAHIFFNDPSVIAPPILKLLGYRSIISRRDMGYWYTPAYLALLRFNSFLIDGAIVNSKAVKDITCQKEWLPSRKVEVIYNGYEFSDEEITPKALRQKENEVVLGIVANIRPIKRMQDAIEATSTLRSNGLSIRLVIVGGGDASELERLASKLDVKDYVDFVGAQSDTASFIKGFDIALLCSESEGFSNAIIEYMQYGKPVVCSRVGGNPEIVDDGKNGLLYEPGDVKSLVEHIERLCSSQEELFQMGKHAAGKVEQRYGMTLMLEKHENLYKAQIEA